MSIVRRAVAWALASAALRFSLGGGKGEGRWFQFSCFNVHDVNGVNAAAMAIKPRTQGSRWVHPPVIARQVVVRPRVVRSVRG